MAREPRNLGKAIPPRPFLDTVVDVHASSVYQIERVDLCVLMSSPTHIRMLPRRLHNQSRAPVERTLLSERVEARHLAPH